jgi:hypothetical protein
MICLTAVKNDCGLNNLLIYITFAGVKGSSLKLSYYSNLFHIFSNQEANPLFEG